MDELSSTEFRKRFARLTSPTVVTVNGHVIGEWRPASHIVDADGFRPDGYVGPGIGNLDRALASGRLDPAAQRFNTQPFTGPIPKVRKP